ncbi:MAG: stress responsive protein [Gammaproteobacteria bacterium]|nr:stress responsive protein [Gammaproteobacteria bacterium]|tara:strand:+ start:908 stop:1201 length:294 start_codon:yes stop_codon:yes gene_type:complete
MIKHIVCWRVDDPNMSQQYCDGAAELLEQMRKEINGLLLLELAVDKSRTDMSSDLVLYSEFASWEALEHYDQHPLHQQFKDYLGPHRTERRVADYEV